MNRGSEIIYNFFIDNFLDLNNLNASDNFCLIQSPKWNRRIPAEVLKKKCGYHNVLMPAVSGPRDKQNVITAYF